MEFKTKMAGLMVGLMVLSAPVVWADGTDMHQGQHNQMMAQILNLTADQEKQLQDSREKQEATMKSTFEQMKANRDAFDTEIVKATPDMAKINDIQAQLKTIQAQMVDNHLSSMLEIKKILTPEQFAGFMALEKAKKFMMHKGHHKSWGDKSDKGNDKQDKD
jgi:Spy/CpxP family protein refolding chaperone